MEKQDLGRRLEFILKTLDRKNFVLAASAAAYPWNFSAELEGERLEFQNTPTGNGWADGHRQFFEKLAGEGFAPKKIALIGTGQDASLIPHALIFPDAEIFVFELIKEKISGAAKSLERMGISLDKIKFIQGNAATELSKYANFFDLIDNQLFLEHLPKRPAPPWLSLEAKKSYCTLQEAVGAMAQALKSGGIMTASDLLVGSEWGFEPAYGLTPNDAVFNLIRQQEGLIVKFKELGWTNRGASAWTSCQEIIDAVSANSGNSLKVLPLNHLVSSDSSDRDSQERLHIIVAYVMASILLGFDANLASTKLALQADSENQKLKEVVGRLEAGADFLWKEIPPHIRLLGGMEIYLKKISMYYLSFKKS
jgi:hypothetical protein